MSGFAKIAQTLLTQNQLQPGPKRGVDVAEQLDHIEIMSRSGFSKENIFRDFRELYDSCEDEDKSIKLQIGKLMVQVHGMLSNDELMRVAPQFTLVIQGDNNRVNTMLCPGAAE